MAKDQIQQISSQINEQTRHLGKLKPKQTKYIKPSGKIQGGESTAKEIYWTRWMFINHTLFGGAIGKEAFAKWIEENSDIQHKRILTNDGNLLETSLPRYSNIVYSVEVKSSTPRSFPVTFNTALPISLVVGEDTILDGPQTIGHTIQVSIPGSDVWTPIYLYVYNPYSEDNVRNKLDVKFNIGDKVSDIRNTMPNAPSDFRASYGTYVDQVKLAWAHSAEIDPTDSVQIFSSTDGINFDLLTSVAGDWVEYSHIGLSEGERRYYKIRYITADGDWSGFSPVKQGLVGATAGAIEIKLPKNVGINDESTVGFYKSSETITVKLDCSLELDAAPTVEIQYPSTTSQYNTLILEESDITEDNSNTFWTFDLDLSDTDKFTNLGEGRAKIIVKGYAQAAGGGGDHNGDGGEAGPLSFAGTITAVRGFVIDDTAPICNNFRIDYDRIDNTIEDAFTYSNDVALIFSDTYDLNTNAIPYYNPDGDETEVGIADGVKSVGGAYQIKWANTEVALVDAPWRLVADVGTFINSHILADTDSEEKTVYAKIRDRAGNESTTLEDSIIFREGLNLVENATSTAHYEYITVSWDELSGSYIDGYYIYKWHQGDPIPILDVTGPDFQIVGQDSVSYQDLNVTGGGVYNYYVRAYAGSPNNQIYSSGFGDQITNSTKTLGPGYDVPQSASSDANKVTVSWATSGLSGDPDPERAASRHLIYRNGIKSIVGATGIGTVDGIVPGATFQFEDTSIAWGVEAFYGAVAENGPWLDNAYYKDETDPVGIWHSTAIGLEDDPPNQVEFFSLNHPYYGFAANPASLTVYWQNNKYYNPEDFDVIGYTIYRRAGTHTDTPTEDDVYSTVSCPDASASGVRWVDYRENMLDSPLWTYWIAAYDLHSTGTASTYVTTGVAFAVPEQPVWTSGDCYASYGYNHLVWEGGGDSYNLQGGYNLYRAELTTEPPEDLLTATGTYGAELVQVHSDKRDQAGYSLIWEDKLDSDNWSKEFCYWVTAFSPYGDQSDASLLTGLDITYPNYESLFTTHLDNGSFERDFQVDTWTLNDEGTNSNLSTDESKFGTKSVCISGYLLSANFDYNQLEYSYVFVSGGSNYNVSAYVKQGDSWDASTKFRLCMMWYDSNNDLLSSSYNMWDDGDVDTADYSRLEFDCTADNAATYGKLRVGLGGNVQWDHCYVDGVQFESDTALAPTRFVDTRAFGADKILAHSIIADMIKAGEIKTRHMIADSIDGEVITAGTITTDKLTVNPVVPETSFKLDSSESVVNEHQLKITTTTGNTFDQAQITQDKGITWVDFAWGDVGSEIPADWTKNSSVLVTAPDNALSYHIYGKFSNGLLYASETYPNDHDFILYQATNHTEASTNGGFFSLESYYGPGVTIEGSDIVAGSFSGKYIEADTISGDKIIANEISGYHIKAKSINAEHITVGFRNMVRNGNFDIYDDITHADDWNTFGTKFDLYTNTISGFDGPNVVGVSGGGVGSQIRTDGSYNFNFKRNQAYVLQFFCYKTDSSLEFYPRLDIFSYASDSADCRVYDLNMNYLGTGIPAATVDEWVIASWVIGPSTNENVTWALEDYDLGEYEDMPYVVFRAHRDGDTFDLSYIDGMTVFQGDKPMNKYISQAATEIRPGYFKTGTIDTDKVNITSTESQVEINSKGISIGSDEKYSLLNDEKLRYVDDNFVTTYGQRTEYHRISTNDVWGSDPGTKQIAMLWYYKPLKNHPQLILNDDNPQICYTNLGYPSGVGQIHSWLLPANKWYANIANGFDAVPICKFAYSQNPAVTGYKLNRVINYSRFYDNSSLYQDASCGYIATGNHNPGDYDVSTPNYIQPTSYTDWITYTGLGILYEISGLCLTTNLNTQIIGPCSGFTYYWSISLFALDSSNPNYNQYEIRETRSGYDKVTLKESAIYTIPVPQQIFALINDVGGGQFGCVGKYGLQYRVWTESAVNIMASGALYKSATAGWDAGKPAILIESINTHRKTYSNANADNRYFMCDNWSGNATVIEG